VTASGDARTNQSSDDARGLEDLEVAVLGCGAVGSALARALAPAGPRLRLWSRTAERAERLAAELSGPAFPALAKH
jgi:glutamyl-tRNA reductase